MFLSQFGKYIYLISMANVFSTIHINDPQLSLTDLTFELNPDK